MSKINTFIDKLYTNDETDVVTVYFTVQKEFQSHQSKVTLPEPDDANYTPYEELTEEMVLSWVTETHEYERAVSLVERKLKDKLQVNESLMPWKEYEEIE